MVELDLPIGPALQQAAVLWRGRGDHVARLVDVASSSEGRLRLIVEAGAFALADVLARGPSLGEAVTVLVPLADCVESLARAGVEHGSIGVDAIHLDASGMPVLGGFGAARLFGVEEVDAIAAGGVDRAAFRALARSVLGSVEEAGEPRRSALLDALEDLDVSAPGALAAFAERLLATAQPDPVRIGLQRTGEMAPIPVVASRSARERRGVARAIVRFLAGLRARRSRVRPRFWVPAVSVGAAVVAALILIPSGDDQRSALGASHESPASQASSDPRPTDPAPAPAAQALDSDPVTAALSLRADATTARVVDDYGDVVLLRIDTASGAEDLLLERTDSGWRLRETLPVEPTR